ncbi:hypothetical protein DF3PA_20131 [Candidatus Defluviicoccus seviourii]|uniref:Uncharacterized protein n=1 Tax=Candidatus Defluviicoccus seviourii TaxID=2565273 RepID=A0A564WD54_9PROT|nr:hypothetical protein DF3PA_20131 [Candidatus Defluviicoccus seviourii]
MYLTPAQLGELTLKGCKNPHLGLFMANDRCRVVRLFWDRLEEGGPAPVVAIKATRRSACRPANNSAPRPPLSARAGARL